MPISFKSTTNGIPQQYEQLFTSSGIWTKPDGVKTCEVKIIGGAGGPIASGSSGAGGYWHGILDVSNETTIPVTIGAAATTSAIGGASSFGDFIETLGSTAGTNGGSPVGGVIDKTKNIDNPIAAKYQEVFGTQSFAISQRNLKRVDRRIFALPISNSVAMTSIVFYDMEQNTVVTQSLPTTVYIVNTSAANVSYANGVWFITGISTVSGSNNVTRIAYSTDGSTWNVVNSSTYSPTNSYAPADASSYYSCVTYVSGNYVVSRSSSGSTSSFMYSTTPNGTWTAVGPTDTTSHGAIMFYDATYSVYVAVVNIATTSTSDDDYRVYTASSITGTWVLAGSLTISGATGWNSPAWQIVKEGSSIYFVSPSQSLTASQTIYVDKVTLTSGTTTSITSTALLLDLYGGAEDVSFWPGPVSMFYKDGYSYIGLALTGTQYTALKIDIVNGTIVETPYALPAGEVAEVSSHTFAFIDEPSATTGYYTWIPSLGGTEVVSAVIPREYYAGTTNTNGSASAGIGGPVTLTSTSTTTVYNAGPGVNGWGLGGADISVTPGDANFGSGANALRPGKSGAVLVRWWI